MMHEAYCHPKINAYYNLWLNMPASHHTSELFQFIHMSVVKGAAEKVHYD